MNRHFGSRLKIAAICVDGELRNQLRAATERDAQFELTAELGQYPADASSRLMKINGGGLPDVVLLDLDRDREAGLSFAARFSKSEGDMASVVAISSSSQPESIIAAMRSGCCEYLLKPVELSKLQETLQRLHRTRPAEQTKAAGQIIALAGAKGGCGVSTLATHLMASLATEHRLRVLLIDLHPDLGSAGTLLGFGNQGYSFHDVAANFHRLDPELVTGMVLKHESGAHVLVSRVHDEMGQTLHNDEEETLTLLQSMYDIIILDVPPGLSYLSSPVVQKADLLELVMVPEVPAVRNLVCALDHLDTIGTARSRVEVVVNRHSRRNIVSDEQIVSAAHQPIAYRIPNRYAVVSEANNLGRPLHGDGRSDYGATMQQWAEVLVARCSPASEPEQRVSKSTFASFFGRKGA